MVNPSTSFDFAIYRCTNPGDTEASVPNDESVGMDYGISDQSDLGVIGFEFDVPARRSDVPAPVNKATGVPDTGMSPTTLTIAIKVNQKIQNQRQAGILIKWGLDDKAIPGTFSRGRFGLRNDNFPWFNFQPDDNAGWKIVDVHGDDLLEWGGQADIIVQMQFGGDTTELIEDIENELGEPT